MAHGRTPIRCAICTRQSVEPYDELSSCQVQFDLCCAYVRSMRSLGFQLIEDRFDDEGYSGTTLDRPALQRLLGVIRAGGIEQLVIYRLDSFRGICGTSPPSSRNFGNTTSRWR